MAMLKRAPMQMAEEALNQLGLLVEAADTSTMQLAVTNVGDDPALQKDFPTPGSQRWIVHRLATGGTLLLPAGVPTDALGPNVNRLGGTIVNWGTTVVVLTLANAATDVAQEGLAEIVLNPEGGSWDFRLGNLMWCGAVSAESLVGEGKLSIAEV